MSAPPLGGTDRSGPAAWPAGPVAQQRVVSFDGANILPTRLRRPDRLAAFRIGGGDEPVIARGSGLSYVDASFGQGVTSIDLSAFDRITGFDAAARLVEVEAGVTLGALFQFLLRHGCYLPVQPGYMAITVGGCIGADVHGKNPAQDGTFLGQVEALRLFHPDHGTIELSETREPELFRATCGGYGLTGLILSARLRVTKLPGRQAEVSLIPAGSVREAAALLGALPPDCAGAHSWHDFARFDRRFGSGHVRILRFAAGADDVAAALPRVSPLTPDRRRHLPVSLWNRWTARAVNAAYASAHRADGAPKRASLIEALFPVHGNEAYYFLFGRAGLYESQVILPESAIEEYVAAIRHFAQDYGIAITLGSAKRFSGGNDLLRYDGTGISLALNIARTRRAPDFLAQLDRIVIAAGGRPNLIKDSRLPRAVFEATYPEADRFRALLRGWDPKRRFRSGLAARLGL